MYNHLKVEPQEHALLLTEPAFNDKETREKLVQLAFEKYNVPGVFLANTAVLSAFAAGRYTAVVVEFGAGATCAVPVVDGYAIKKGTVFYHRYTDLP